jgi:hypothetical protein
MTPSPSYGAPLPAPAAAAPHSASASDAHRMAFWPALRRWAESAVAAGVLRLDQIRNGSAEACTLLPEALGRETSRALIAPSKHTDGPEAMLDELLAELLNWPHKELIGLLARLPGELVDRLWDRIDRWW